MSEFLNKFGHLTVGEALALNECQATKNNTGELGG